MTRPALTFQHSCTFLTPFSFPDTRILSEYCEYCEWCTLPQLAFLYKSCMITTMAQTITELTALLTAVDEAIAKLMSGERVIRISNGDRMAEYGQAKLGDLQDYKSSLIAEINALNSRPRHFRISSSKGV